MSEIRVRLLGLTRLVQDILVAAIEAEPDMVVVGDGEGAETGTEIEPGGSADVVIMDEAESVCDAVLRNPAQHGLVAVRADGRIAVVCHLDPDQSIVRELSPERLVQCVRDLARSTEGPGRRTRR